MCTLLKDICECWGVGNPQKHPASTDPFQNSICFGKNLKKKFPTPFWKTLVSCCVGIGIVWVATTNPAGRAIFHAVESTYKEAKLDGRKNNKGSKSRNRLTYSRKAAILDEFLSEKEDNLSLSQEQFVIGKPYNQSDLSKWLAQRDKIFQSAANFNRAGLFSAGKFKNKNSAAYPLMEDALHQAFQQRRSEGRSCSVHWFKYKAKYLMDLMYNGVKFGASTGWFMNFCNRHDLVLRRKTNKTSFS